jgi:GntR family transcriptional regulator, transcriptional repressor for pyruvate dehydrogenase complex
MKLDDPVKFVENGGTSTPLVERTPLVEKIVSALVEYISASNLEAGNKLPSETKLSEMFGVSRLALREALIRLKALGLIEARHGTGWFVRRFEPADSFRQLSPLLKNFTGADLNQIMQVRMILEPVIARIAAENVSAAGLKVLEQHLQCMKDNIRDRERFIECDMAFHATLARECGNKILTVLNSILTDLGRSAQWAYKNTVDNRERSWKFHWGIFQALSAGNGLMAEKAMAEHIQDVFGRIETNEE